MAEISFTPAELEQLEKATNDRLYSIARLPSVYDLEITERLALMCSVHIKVLRKGLCYQCPHCGEVGGRCFEVAGLYGKQSICLREMGAPDDAPNIEAKTKGRKDDADNS